MIYNLCIKKFWNNLVKKLSGRGCKYGIPLSSNYLGKMKNPKSIAKFSRRGR